MAHDRTRKAGIEANQVFDLTERVEYGHEGTASRKLMDSGAGTVTPSVLDEGQGFSEHTAPFDASAQVVDSRGEFIIGGVRATCGPGRYSSRPQTPRTPCGLRHASRRP